MLEPGTYIMRLSSWKQFLAGYDGNGNPINKAVMQAKPYRSWSVRMYGFNIKVNYKIYLISRYIIIYHYKLKTLDSEKKIFLSRLNTTPPSKKSVEILGNENSHKLSYFLEPDASIFNPVKTREANKNNRQNYECLLIMGALKPSQ